MCSDYTIYDYSDSKTNRAIVPPEYAHRIASTKRITMCLWQRRHLCRNCRTLHRHVVVDGVCRDAYLIVAFHRHHTTDLGASMGGWPNQSHHLDGHAHRIAMAMRAHVFIDGNMWRVFFTSECPRPYWELAYGISVVRCDGCENNRTLAIR